MTEKMLRKESKKDYIRRKTTVEPVIGDIKWNMGLSHFSVHGFAAKVEVGLCALWHNIKVFVKMCAIRGMKWRYA